MNFVVIACDMLLFLSIVTCTSRCASLFRATSFIFEFHPSWNLYSCSPNVRDYLLMASSSQIESLWSSCAFCEANWNNRKWILLQTCFANASQNFKSLTEYYPHSIRNLCRVGWRALWNILGEIHSYTRIKTCLFMTLCFQLVFCVCQRVLPDPCMRIGRGKYIVWDGE